MDFSIAILAGGRSRRMGQDKGLAPLGGRAMVEHVLAAAAPLGAEVFLATNRAEDYAYLGLRIAQDEWPGSGSLEGLRTALAAAATEKVLVLACDLPFLRRPLLEHLARQTGEFQALVPRVGGRLHPLVATYERSCLPEVEAARARGEMSLQALLETIVLLELDETHVRNLDPDGLSFINVNSHDELMEAERIFEAMKQASGP